MQPAILIIPCGEFLVAADLHLPRAAANDDYVLPVNQPALHLLNFTIRQPVRAALDLCCGSTLHGMAASGFSRHVVASDLSPRAGVFGRFNAALNGCHNLEFRSGHLFSTVADQKFDLILCNPPFVISPTAKATFRDNPLELDSFVRDLLRQAPKHLEEGGFLQMICEWVEVRGQDWQDRLQAWLSDAGCDAWILQANRQLPDTYARGRLREATADDDELEEGRSQWLQYFQHHDVEAVYGGLIFLRRRLGPNWFDVTQLTSNVEQPVGETIRQGFGNRDLLYARGGDESLLNSRPRIAPGLGLEEKSHWEEEAWQSDSLVLRLEKGLPVSIGIDAHVRGLLERFDGRRSVADAADDFARHLGLPADEVRKTCVQIVRNLIENGCLLPEDS